jgi:hypothetical protein
MTADQITALLQVGQGLTVAGLLLAILYAGSRGTWVYGTTFRQTHAELNQQIGELKARITALEAQHDQESSKYEAQIDALRKENVQLSADLRVAHIEIATLRARVVSGAGTA